MFPRERAFGRRATEEFSRGCEQNDHLPPLSMFPNERFQWRLAFRRSVFLRAQSGCKQNFAHAHGNYNKQSMVHFFDSNVTAQRYNNVIPEALYGAINLPPCRNIVARYCPAFQCFQALSTTAYFFFFN